MSAVLYCTCVPGVPGPRSVRPWLNVEVDQLELVLDEKRKALFQASKCVQHVWEELGEEPDDLDEDVC